MKGLKHTRNKMAHIFLQAVTYAQQGEYKKAESQCYEALKFDKNNLEVYRLLGSLAKVQGKLAEASEFYKKVLAKQDKTENLISYGEVMFCQGYVDEALEVYRKVLMRGEGSDANRSRYLFMLNFSGNADASFIAEEHKKWAKQCSSLNVFPRRSQSEKRRLRIGYVSPNFYRHSVGYFIEAVLAAHDKHKFEIIAYADLHFGTDDRSERIKALVDKWYDVTVLSDEELLQTIVRDDVDILIDLAGHTAFNRLGVFAKRAALLQISWLGYPNTTGVSNMDYRLTDAFADPIGETELWHTEKIWHLPESFLCYLPLEDAPAVTEPPCLAKGYITFGSFNYLSEITNQTIVMWAEILKNAPTSRMIIKSKGMDDAGAKQRIISLFANQGIDKQRFELRDWHASTKKHLTQYEEVDIALDTFPYHGTTTTCEALWMGVPVITLLGNRHAARVGLSLLASVGLEALAVKTQEDYVKKAVQLSVNLNIIKSIRAELRTAMQKSILTDAKQFTKKLEDAYHKMFFIQDSSAEEEKQIMNREDIKAAVEKAPFWYHKISLPGDIITPGWAPINQSIYQIPEDLTGLRILDIGAWDGYWTFEALKRGARQVVAIDDFSDYLGQLENSDRRAWENFDLCKKAFGYTDEQCQRYDMSVYDVTEEKLGKFDIVFFFGVLYHLRYPMLALDKLSAVCTQSLYVESAILDDYSPYRGGFDQGYPGQMVMEFYPNKEYGSNETNWWVPSLLCLANMVYAAGFSDVDFWKLSEKPQSLPYCRGFIKAVR